MSTKVAQEFMAPSHLAPEDFKAASVSAAALIGTWKNVNSATRDLVKIVISASGTGIHVDAFGACSPTPCNWGTVTGLAYASNVSATPAVAFSAQYTFSFSHVILIGHLVGKELVVESFTQFTDGSGRSNLYTADTMVK
ncbi:hypothetical protein [Granulicella arctica]|uniref:hypothetical protein n=1 Tax=Granulicella arctica TaxID=940613 RepID=UPI0021DF9B40|nr:hypothetical protein [Granulicella arctica]